MAHGQHNNADFDQPEAPFMGESASAATLAALLQSSVYTMIGTDTAGTITVFNRAAEQLLGYTAGELVHRHTPAVFHDPTEVVARAAELSRELGRPLEAGFEVFVALARETGAADERPWTYVRKDGTRVPVLLSITAVRGSDGALNGYLGIARDITELATVKRQLVEHADRLRLIFEASLDSTFVIDEVGTIQDLNPAVERVLGYARSELRGQNIRNIMPEPYASAHSGYLARYLATGEKRIIGRGREVPIRRKDGSVFPAELEVVEVRSDGSRVFVGTLRDISARKLAEAERDRLLSILEATSDFVGMADAEGRLIYQNRAGRILIGWDENTDLGTKQIKDVHPAWAAKQIRDEAIPAAARLGCMEHETALQHVNGTEIPVSQVLIVHQQDGQVSHFSTIMRDLRQQQRTHALLTKIAAQVPGMLFELVMRGETVQLLYVSPGIRDLYDLSPEDVRTSAQALLERIPPEDRAQFIPSMQAAAAERRPWTLEYRCISADGGLRWHHGHGVAENQPDGSVVWYGYITDITFRHRIAEAELQARARLEDAIASMDAGFAMFDAEARLLVCNKQFSELKGIPAAVCVAGARYVDVLRATLEANRAQPDFLPPGLSEAGWIQSRLDQFSGDRASQVLRMGERWIHHETRRVASGGTVFLVTDVSALKQADFEARVQGQRLALATETSEIGIWDLDLTTGALVWDARMLAMYGFEPQSFPGAYDAWKACVHPDDIEATEHKLRQCIAQDSEFRHRFRIVHPDKSLRHIDARAGFVRDSGGDAVRMIGANQDITEQVETELRLRAAAEAAQLATRAKADFLATMSHEIRTPMNGVIGMTNLLMATRLDPEQRSFAETIRSSGESLLTLINDILDFSKMEAGKLQIESVPFCLTDLVHAVVNLFTEEAEKKKIELVTEPRELERIVVVGDPTRVRQVLLNLVSNALKFTQAGRVCVHLSAVNSEQNSLDVVLAVSDTGIGMSAEHIARLGEVFTQADASTSRHFGGTGLGISICKKLVDMMSGTLSIQSVRGEGSTFTLRLPMTTALELEPAKRNSVIPRNDARRLRILVAEDNIVNQRVVALMLKKYADVIDIAADGREAIARFRASNYDCVLMDGQMPDVDGFEATRLIRAYEEESQLPRTPIIALTANALPGDREAFLLVGMDEYLSKPLRTRDLAQMLERVTAGEFDRRATLELTPAFGAFEIA